MTIRLIVGIALSYREKPVESYDVLIFVLHERVHITGTNHLVVKFEELVVWIPLLLLELWPQQDVDRTDPKNTGEVHPATNFAPQEVVDAVYAMAGGVGRLSTALAGLVAVPTICGSVVISIAGYLVAPCCAIPFSSLNNREMVG